MTHAVRLVLVGFALWLGGCAPYQLQGVVKSGPGSTVMVVDRDDDRLDSDGMAGAVVELTLDPNSLSPKRVGAAVTDDQGRFTITVGETGAGFLEYEAGLLVRMDGHKTVWQTLPLPSSRQAVVILMEPGAAGNPRPRDIIEETLEMAE
ncbi:MAG: hypothetical protein R3336_00125 [Phycisphaeraceae bacterium]|nr:hypothetical protein [Phycisphaeraceae bacterium]